MMKRMMLVGLLALSGCQFGAPPPENRDAGAVGDAGRYPLDDAGANVDAGLVVDGGTERDGGSEGDGGREDDGGISNDGGRLGDGGLSQDGGAPGDAGALSDGGRPIDGGLASDGGIPPDGGVLPDGGAFIVSTDRSKIALVEVDSLVADGQTYRREFYRNTAYRCGRSGFFTFVIIEKSGAHSQEAPLWAFLHGGGVGYYDRSQTYHGGEGHNDEESKDDLTSHILPGFDVTPQNGSVVYSSKPVVVPRRLAQGYRLLLPSMCDHDLYGGLGNVYPNDPHWAAQGGDRVEGLQATLSAILFTAKGNGLQGASRLAPHPTSYVFLHGGSAGSAGTYHVSAAMARLGMKPNGAILDSYLVNTREEVLMGHGCTPTNQDPEFSIDSAKEKIGKFLSDPTLYVEATVSGAFAFPMFDVVGSNDPYCCGGIEAVPEAAQAGFTNNCRWVHDVLEKAAAERPDGSLVSMVVSGLGHVITHDEGPHQTAIETWLAGILAKNPPKPVFPLD
jgi:hypothetical protein